MIVAKKSDRRQERVWSRRTCDGKYGPRPIPRSAIVVFYFRRDNPDTIRREPEVPQREENALKLRGEGDHHMQHLFNHRTIWVSGKPWRDTRTEKKSGNSTVTMYFTTWFPPMGLNSDWLITSWRPWH